MGRSLGGLYYGRNLCVCSREKPRNLFRHGLIRGQTRELALP